MVRGLRQVYPLLRQNLWLRYLHRSLSLERARARPVAIGEIVGAAGKEDRRRMTADRRKANTQSTDYA